MNPQQNLRTMVRAAYDMQKLRIQMGNRIAGNFKVKLGQEPGEKEETLDDDAKKVLKEIRTSYKKLTDGVKSFPRKATFKGDGVIDSYAELCLIRSYVEFEKNEDRHFRAIGAALEDIPIWTVFLSDVIGVGPAMGGVIVSEIDIAKAKYPSSLWKYAGLDVASDGRGRSKKAEHLIDVEYVDKDGNNATRKGITFNPFLKTKLVGVLGSSFLRCGKDNTYSIIFYDYKHRLENHPVHSEKIKGQRHNMAIRYMIKEFLADLYTAWREIEGLTNYSSYAEAKLGVGHRKAV